MNVMMTLGKFQFGVDTAAYQELSRTTEYRWPSQERYQDGPALQFVGPGGDTMTLPGVVYPEWKGGLGQLDTLRDLAAEGKPQTLIDGRGRVLGEWVVERVEETQSVFAIKGAARKQEFTISLRKFGDVKPAPMAASGAPSIEGVNFASPVTGTTAALQNISSLNVSVASQAGGFINTLSGAVKQVTAVTAQIGEATSSVLSPLGRAIDVATGLKNAATDAKKLLGAIPTSLSGISSITGLVSATSTAVNNATAASGSLTSAFGHLSSLGTISDTALGAVKNAMTAVNGLTVATTKMQIDATQAEKDLNFKLLVEGPKLE